MHFRPRNSQDAAQLGFAPGRKLVLGLSGANRANGVFESAIEGDWLYIEKTDYPFLLTYLSQGNGGDAVNFVAHAGLMIPGPFKGLVVTHPDLAVVAGQIHTASLILGTGAYAPSNNEFAYPEAAGWPAIATPTFTVTDLTCNIYVPPGSKFLSNLNVTIQATTITSAIWQLLRQPNNGSLQAPLLNADGFAYTANNFAWGYLDVTVPLTGAFRLGESCIPIPSGTSQMRLTVVGTGLATANFGVRANFA